MGKNTYVMIIVVILILLGAWFVMSQQATQPTTTTPITDEATEEATTTEADSITVQLAPVSDPDHDSDMNQSGSATLTEVDGKVIVTIAIDTPTGIAASQPAHIHKGACPGVGEVAYALTNVAGGGSTTTLDTTMEELRAQMPLAVNIHESTSASSMYTACGDIL